MDAFNICLTWMSAHTLQRTVDSTISIQPPKKMTLLSMFRFSSFFSFPFDWFQKHTLSTHNKLEFWTWDYIASLYDWTLVCFIWCSPQICVRIQMFEFWKWFIYFVFMEENERKWIQINLSVKFNWTDSEMKRNCFRLKNYQSSVRGTRNGSRHN